MIKALIFASLLFVVFFTHCALATNTSGVHGPVINPKDKSAMYRLGFSPGEDGASDAYAHRFHYQQAYNEHLRWRVITQFRDRGEDFEYDYLRAELLWYLTPNREGIWDTALRFDIRTRKGSRPERFAINWTNQWAFNNGWRLRGILIGNWEFGGTADTGLAIESRASLTYKLSGGNRLGLEMFSEYGDATDMGSFNGQEHALGPVLSGKVSGIGYQVGYLAGLTSETNDHTFRLWFSRKF